MEGRSSIRGTGSCDMSTDWNLGVAGTWAHVSSGISSIEGSFLITNGDCILNAGLASSTPVDL